MKSGLTPGLNVTEYANATNLDLVVELDYPYYIEIVNPNKDHKAKQTKFTVYRQHILKICMREGGHYSLFII